MDDTYSTDAPQELSVCEVPTIMTIQLMHTAMGFTFFVLWALIAQIAVSERY